MINSLGAGGAERVMNALLHAAPSRDWEVHLALLDQEAEHRIPPSHVRVHQLDCGMRLLPSVLRTKRLVQRLKPDVVVSFLVRANIAAVVAARTNGVPVVISERAHLSTHIAGRHKSYRRFVATLLPRLFYPRATRIIACSDGVRSDLLKRFGVRSARCRSIPNPVDLELIRRDAEQPPERLLPKRFMISVGRLVETKGFGELIDAYALARPDISLCILGEGPERSKLEARIRALGIEDRVQLLGYARNPFAILAKADFYISASHCEGFPNALAEAMSVGLPVISTDCPSGPAEILAGVESADAQDLIEAQYGMLTPVRNVEALAKAIRRMSAEEIRDHYAAQSLIRIEDFSKDRILARYWNAFAELPISGMSAGQQPSSMAPPA
jgi:glycosyltransferase involved in cell wall biosynthesis